MDWRLKEDLDVIERATYGDLAGIQREGSNPYTPTLNRFGSFWSEEDQARAEAEDIVARVRGRL